MLQALTLLLIFQLAGEALVQMLVLPIPGPVVGLALLALAMAARPQLANELRETAQGLLQHLSLLFVPAGVGVMLHAGRVFEEWPAIMAALLLGTLITLAVTALTIRLCLWLTRRKERA
jgi:holin-like protein